MKSFNRALKTTLHLSLITELQTHCWVTHAEAVYCILLYHFALFRTRGFTANKDANMICHLFKKIPARLHKDFSPSASVNVTLWIFWIVVNEVTPPNFCLAQSTSSSSSVGKCCLLTLSSCPLESSCIVESLFIWKVEPRSCQLVS